MVKAPLPSEVKESFLSAASGANATRLASAQGQPNRAGMVPLHIAAAAGNLQIASQLLAAGASVNTQTSTGGKTALHFALDFHEKNGTVDNDIGSADDGNCCFTPTWRHPSRLVRALIEHGADGNTVCWPISDRSSAAMDDDSPEHER